MENKNFNKNQVWQIGTLLIVYFFVVVYRPSQEFLILVFHQWISGSFAINVAVYALPIFLAIVFFGKEVVQNFSYFKQKPILKIVLAILAFGLILFGNFLAALASGTSDTQNQDILNQAASSVPIVYSALLFAILGPFLEEVVFRHIMIGKLSKFINEKLLVVISFVTFVLIHVNTPLDIINYLPVATVLTGAYLLSKKNIAFSFLVHMINNMVVVVLVPLLIK